MRARLSTILVAFLVLLTLLAAACGGDDDGDTKGVVRLTRLDVSTEGTSASLTASLDVGTDEAGTLAIDWGDGFRQEQPLDPGTDELRFEHDYAAAGEYEVSVTVSVGADRDSTTVLATIEDASRAAAPVA